MSTKTAGDLMIPLDKYPHIPYWFTLRQALAEFDKSIVGVRGHQSLPRALLVFDEKYCLLGTIRQRDILRGLEPKFLKTMALPNRRMLFDVEADPNLVDFSSGKVGQAIKEQAELPVSEIMIPTITTVNFDDHLAKVIYKMVTHDLSMVPVLRDGKVVGAVRSVDALHEIANLLL